MRGHSWVVAGSRYLFVLEVVVRWALVLRANVLAIVLVALAL